ALSFSRGVSPQCGVVQLVVELGEAPSILPERFPIEQRAGVAVRNRFFTRCADERERGHELTRPRHELAEVPEPFQIRHVNTGALEVDAPDTSFGPKGGALGRLGARRL